MHHFTSLALSLHVYVYVHATDEFAKAKLAIVIKMPVLRVRLNKLSSDWQVARALLEDEYTSLDKALNKFRTRYEFAAHLLDVHRMWCVRRALARPACLPVRSDGDAADAARSKIYVSASTQTGIKQEDHDDESNHLEKDKVKEQREEGVVDCWIDDGRPSNLQDQIPDKHQHSADVQSCLEGTNPVSDLLIKQERPSQEHCDVDMDSGRNGSTSQQRNEEGIPTQNIRSHVQSNFAGTIPVSDLLIKQEVVSKENHDVDMESSMNESTSQQRHEEGIPTPCIRSDVQSNFENTNQVSDLLIKQERASQEHCDVDMDSSMNESASRQRREEGIPTQHIRSDVQSRLERTNPFSDVLIKQEVVSHENCDVDMDIRRNESTSHQGNGEGILTQHIRSDGKTVMDSNDELSSSTHHYDEHSPELSSQDLCDADGKTIVEKVSRPTTHHRNKRSPEGLAPDLRDEDGQMIVHSNNEPSSSTLHYDERSPECFSQDLCDADGKTILENIGRPSRTTNRRNKHSPEGSSRHLCDSGISSNKNLRNSSRSEKRNSFQCKSCSKTYFSLSVFHLHMKTHAGLKLQSQKTHTSQKPKTCSVCEKDFITKARLAVHMRTHSGQKPNQCSVCNKAFTNSVDLSRHMRTHTGEKPFECNCCSYRCSDKSHLTLHMRTHSGQKPYQCSICNKAFTTSGYLSCHMRTHTGEKPYKCNCCSYRCSQKSSLTLHMRTHTGEKPFECNFCSFRCSGKSNLTIHMRTHTGEKPFECNCCSYRCSDNGNLTTHMRTHTGEKPFKCNCCIYKCSKKSSLTRHMRTHTGEKPYQCSVCNKAFTNSGDLSRHMRTHTGAKPYQCPICSKRFIQKGEVNRHMKTHTGEKP